MLFDIIERNVRQGESKEKLYLADSKRSWTRHQKLYSGPSFEREN